MNDTQHVLNEVAAISRQAGELSLHHFGRVSPHQKADRSIVTKADREVESFIRRELSIRFPDDAIIGEEHDATVGTSPWTWAIDPIDGTVNFVAELPDWCICIARLKDGIPDIGAVHIPVLGDLYLGAMGVGATLNGGALSVAGKALAQEQLLVAWAQAERRIDLAGFQGAMLDFGSTAVKLAYVARGSFAAAFTPEVRVWDLAAAMPILWQAGAECRRVDGTLYRTMDLDPRNGHRVPLLIHAREDMQRRVRGMVAFTH